MPRKPRSPARRARGAFSQEDLRRICTMPEWDFADAFGMQTVIVKQEAPANFYHFRDNGSRVLAVAHLDTVAPAEQRDAHFVNSEAGRVVFSRALDDRLGAYIILCLLPALGITYDWLLTTGEEWGMSTASFFEAPKTYDWIIEFDRGGTDVVMYQYDDFDTRKLVRAAGAEVGQGIFSDIGFLEHLGVKAFNWGTGYRDYHSIRSHAFLSDTFAMVGKYLRFHELYAGTAMPHWPRATGYGRPYADSEEGCVYCSATGTVDPVTAICAECQFCQDCFSPAGECACYTPARTVTPASGALVRPDKQDWDAEDGSFASKMDAG